MATSPARHKEKGCSRARRARPLQWFGALAALLALAGGAACGGDDGETAAPSVPGAAAATTTTEPAPGPDDPAFSDTGPYAVGVTTLTLADGRAVEVFYPAGAGSEDGHEQDSYETTEPLSPELRALAPASVDLRFTYPAYRDLPVSEDAPFPVVLFSHGFGGWRLVQATLTSGIASWGFVVASIDHTERGLVSLVSGTASGDTERDAAVVRQVLARLVEANDEPAGPLTGRLDLERVGAAGHSAGGATVLALRGEPRIDAVVAWASAPWRATAAETTPALMIGAERDIALTPEVIRGMYGELAGDKALVMIDGAGHNSFTDVCQQIRDGVNLVDIAVEQGFPIPENFLELGTNGCGPDDLEPRRAWSVIQHFTVAFLRAYLYDGPPPAGITEQPGLGDGVAETFAGVSLTYDHVP